ncbi:oxidoreductase [Apiospora marii]|uniref:Oxidoreductase n=1 Tax=Apiospora marii TaxID=335849 RepID=A0ABR1R777_9PEZI
MYSLKQVTSCALALAIACLSWPTSAVARPHKCETDKARYINDSSLLKDAYDYVIVGGGTSGLTVADRLTEHGKVTVLVIENGPLHWGCPFSNSRDSDAVTEVRGGVGAFGSPYFYRIQSAPKPSCTTRRTPVLIGNAVGGSSAVNAMMTLFRGGGSGRASLWGGTGAAAFKRGVTFTEPEPAVREKVNITYDASYWGDTSPIEAFREIPGVEFPPDSGSGRAGVYWHPSFMDPKKVQRSYARTGHYDGINRTSYDLVYNSKGDQAQYRGSESNWGSFPNDGQKRDSPERRVTLAAGAVHTPQLLQLSGVGPKTQLEEAGIETVVDLPGVGQNFQDHPMLGMAIMLRNFTVHPSPMDLFTNRPYSIGIGNVVAWLGMPVVSPERHETIASRLEAQDHAAYLPPDTDPTVLASVLSGSNMPAGMAVHLYPLSRGSVRLNASAPATSEPIVDYRTLSNPLDVEILTEFVRFTRAYHFNTSLAAYGPQELMPGSDVTSDEDLAEFIHRNAGPPFTSGVARPPCCRGSWAASWTRGSRRRI